MNWKWKGQTIYPYEGFYRTDTEKFFRGCIGEGISRACKCDDSLTILEVVYENNGQVQFPDSD